MPFVTLKSTKNPLKLFIREDSSFLQKPTHYFFTGG